VGVWGGGWGGGNGVRFGCVSGGCWGGPLCWEYDLYGCRGPMVLRWELRNMRAWLVQRRALPSPHVRSLEKGNAGKETCHAIHPEPPGHVPIPYRRRFTYRRKEKGTRPGQRPNKNSNTFQVWRDPCPQRWAVPKERPAVGCPMLHEGIATTRKLKKVLDKIFEHKSTLNAP